MLFNLRAALVKKDFETMSASSYCKFLNHKSFNVTNNKIRNKTRDKYIYIKKYKQQVQTAKFTNVSHNKEENLTSLQNAACKKVL